MTTRATILCAAALLAVAGCSTSLYIDAAPAEPGEVPGGDPGPGPGTGPGTDPGTDPGPDPGPDTDPGTDPEPVDAVTAAFMDILGDFETLDARAGALGAAPDAAVPLAGKATYKGVAEVGLGAGDGAAVLYGEARVSADFEDGEVSGDVDHVVGRVGGGPAQEFDGRLDIEEAEGTPGSAGFEVTASGTLTSAGHVLTFDAPLEGSFLGAGAEAVEIRSLPGQGTGSIDGTVVGATMGLWAEEVWRGE